MLVYCLCHRSDGRTPTIIVIIKGQFCLEERSSQLDLSVPPGLHLRALVRVARFLLDAYRESQRCLGLVSGPWPLKVHVSWKLAVWDSCTSPWQAPRLILHSASQYHRRHAQPARPIPMSRPSVRALVSVVPRILPKLQSIYPPENIQHCSTTRQIHLRSYRTELSTSTLMHFGTTLELHV